MRVLRVIRRISIHAPRTGSDREYAASVTETEISIHAPRTGSDFAAASSAVALSQFQSTLPARGATRRAMLSAQLRIPHFNPRSPHGERLSPTQNSRSSLHFNPRSPHGERRAAPVTHAEPVTNFNPRSPHGERQRQPDCHAGCVRFQSTLPARGATAYSPANANNGNNFNPRSPHGERPAVHPSISSRL